LAAAPRRRGKDNEDGDGESGGIKKTQAGTGPPQKKKKTKPEEGQVDGTTAARKKEVNQSPRPRHDLTLVSGRWQYRRTFDS
jgi:hypothetical protein